MSPEANPRGDNTLMRATRASILTIAVATAALTVAGCSSSTSDPSPSAASTAPTSSSSPSSADASAAPSDGSSSASSDGGAGPSSDPLAGFTATPGELQDVTADQFGAAYAAAVDEFYGGRGDRALVGVTPANDFQGESVITLNADGSAFGSMDGVEGGMPGQQIACNTVTCYTSADEGKTWEEAGPASVIQPQDGAASFISLQSLNAGTGAESTYRLDGAGLFEYTLPNGNGVVKFQFNGDNYVQSGELKVGDGSVQPIDGTYAYGDPVALPDNLPAN